MGTYAEQEAVSVSSTKCTRFFWELQLLGAFFSYVNKVSGLMPLMRVLLTALNNYYLVGRE